MQPDEKFIDTIRLFDAHGYGTCGVVYDAVIMARPGSPGTAIRIDDTFVAVLDSIYQKGFQEGFERGAYEQMTQEDAEPVQAQVATPSVSHYGTVSLYNKFGVKAQYKGYQDQNVVFVQTGAEWRVEL